MNYNICVIGNEALLFPFLQFGFTTYTPDSEEALREQLLSLIEADYGIIYIEDSYCLAVSDIISKYSEGLTPIFIPIGEDDQEESFSKQMARKMMERAIGINIV